MKLLKKEITNQYHEIQIERSFLFIKWVETYRKVGQSLFKYKDGLYESADLGLTEHFLINRFFDIK